MFLSCLHHVIYSHFCDTVKFLHIAVGSYKKTWTNVLVELVRNPHCISWAMSTWLGGKGNEYYYFPFSHGESNSCTRSSRSWLGGSIIRSNSSNNTHSTFYISHVDVSFRKGSWRLSFPALNGARSHNPRGRFYHYVGRLVGKYVPKTCSWVCWIGREAFLYMLLESWKCGKSLILWPPE